ncbi:MAG: UDP-N-acetylmuramate dehydrogenase [Salibacteraceae bacterium]
MQIEQNINLKPFNTFGLSSYAERLVRVQSESDLPLYFDEQMQRPSLVLGGGSNLLLTKNLPGDTLKIELPGIDLVAEDNQHYYVKVGAGEEWHRFVLTAIENGWAGVENLSLIPGNVGAAPMQNIGAYGVELKDVFHSLTAFLTEENRFESYGLTDCQFGYRESVFKRALKNKAIIASVTFKLNKEPSFNTAYGAIETELDRMKVSELSIKAISDAVISIRQSKLPDPKKLGNSGSFFKNPVIDRAHFLKLQNEFPSLVAYPAGEDRMKVAAGWLIQHAGFKGKRFGACGVHEKQALVLVNYGDAKGSEIYDLSEKIIEKIEEMYDIRLEREVNIIP